MSSEKEVDFLSDNVSERDIVFSDAETKRLLRKVDYRLLPVLTLLYLMSFLDRSNIGNARVAGLDVSLGLSDFQYNMCLTIFFFPYALFEVPSNIVLKFLKPRLWLTIIVLAWGTVMTLMGLVQNYAGLLAARFWLGVTEAGLFPAASFILT
jgi:sugar phosphate permease